MPLSAPAQDLQSTINSFAAQTPQVTAAALASSDGLLITASNGLDRDHADELAAVACGVVSIVSGSTARMFGEDRVELTLARLTHRTLLVKPVADGSVLAVITSSDIDVERVSDLIDDLARRVGQLLTPELRAELQQAQL